MVKGKKKHVNKTFEKGIAVYGWNSLNGPVLANAVFMMC